MVRTSCLPYPDILFTHRVGSGFYLDVSLKCVKVLRQKHKSRTSHLYLTITFVLLFIFITMVRITLMLDVPHPQAMTLYLASHHRYRACHIRRHAPRRRRRCVVRDYRHHQERSHQRVLDCCYSHLRYFHCKSVSPYEVSAVNISK